jgi:hypothetical protein
MKNIKELKRVLSTHYATGPAKLFFTPIISAVETGMQRIGDAYIAEETHIPEDLITISYSVVLVQALVPLSVYCYCLGVRN